MITSSPDTGTTPPTQVEVDDQLPEAAEVMVAAWAFVKLSKEQMTHIKTNLTGKERVDFFIEI
jgi:hypothetical protein